LPMQRD